MRFVPVLILVVAAGAAEAQRPTPGRGGRSAGIAPPPAEAPAVVVVPGRYHGHRQALRPCAVHQAAPALAGVRVGTVAPAAPVAQIQRPQVAQPAMPAPPTFTQPVPAQPTASEQMLGRSLGGGGQAHQRVRTSCYTRDAFGNIIIH